MNNEVSMERLLFFVPILRTFPDFRVRDPPMFLKQKKKYTLHRNVSFHDAFISKFQVKSPKFERD